MSILELSALHGRAEMGKKWIRMLYEYYKDCTYKCFSVIVKNKTVPLLLVVKSLTFNNGVHTLYVCNVII